jgi:hypothetical protein
MDLAFVMTGVTAIIGLIFILVPLLRELQRLLSKTKEPTLQDKIAELTKSLASSVAVVSEIEQEILKRQELVAKQKADMARYEQLMQVSKDQLEAIIQTLSIPVKKETNKSIWFNVIASLAIAGAFFALGYFTRGGG